MDTQIHEIAKKIFYIFPLVITSIGTIGNIISIAIFTSKRFSNRAFVFYNIYILIFELLIYYFGALKYYIQAAYTNPMNATLFLCKFLNYTIRPLEETAVWVHLLMTLDRYLLVHCPIRLKILDKRWFNVLMVAIITLAFFAFNLPIALYHEIRYAFDPYKNSSSFMCTYSEQHKTVFIVVDFGLIFFLCLIPFTLMLYMSISISIILFRLKRRLRINNQGISRKERQFAVLTIGQNFMFLIFIFPFSIFMPFFSLLRTGTISIAQKYVPYVELFNAIASTLLYFYYSSSIFINLAFNKLFRDIFMRRLGYRSNTIINIHANMNTISS